MLNLKSKKVHWGIVSLCVLLVSYILARYVFFDLHGMGEMPFTLLIFDIFVIIIAFNFNARKTMIVTSVSYIIGFIAGVLFESDYVELVTYDGTVVLGNDQWIWWAGVNFALVCVGVIWQIVCFIVKRLKKQ